MSLNNVTIIHYIGLRFGMTASFRQEITTVGVNIKTTLAGREEYQSLCLTMRFFGATALRMDCWMTIKQNEFWQVKEA